MATAALALAESRAQPALSNRLHHRDPGCVFGVGVLGATVSLSGGSWTSVVSRVRCQVLSSGPQESPNQDTHSWTRVNSNRVDVPTSAGIWKEKVKVPTSLGPVAWSTPAMRFAASQSSDANGLA